MLSGLLASRQQRPVVIVEVQVEVLVEVAGVLAARLRSCQCFTLAVWCSSGLLMCPPPRLLVVLLLLLAVLVAVALLVAALLLLLLLLVPVVVCWTRLRACALLTLCCWGK